MTSPLVKYTFEHDQGFVEGRRAFTGKILHVNLTKQKFSLDEKNEAFYRKFIGGRGFVLHYLLREMPAGVDSLSPENVLVFATGLLTGTIVPGSGRHGVGAKSPLTGALASGEAGGWWGHELKRAGLDAIIIHGKAPSPVYISIDNGSVEIRSASHLWGSAGAETDEAVKNEIGNQKARVALIGVAGENLVRYSCVINDINRVAGRSGLGAVMGSKNLKAIAVAGNKSVGLAEKEGLKKSLKWIRGSYKETMAWAINFGTPGSVGPGHDSGGMQMRNYLAGSLENIEQLRHEYMFDKLITGRDTCSNCPVNCKVRVNYKDTKTQIDGKYGGPEYESIGALGALCAVGDAVAISKANELCATYGLDTISTGGTIAFAMECVENGLLSDYEFQPRFGDSESLINAIHKIAHREGLGTLMAEGSAIMASELGPESDEFIAVAKGQELPLHDPRQKNVAGLGYALSPTGADHMHNMIDSFANFADSDVCARLSEIGIETPLPLFGITEEKVKAFTYESSFRHMLDCAVICHFYPYEYKHMVEILGAAGGWRDFDISEIQQIGFRISTLGRLFLLREGFTFKDDTLSPRSLLPTRDGPIAGKTIDPIEFANGIQEYYKLMDWDADGVPTEACLSKLGLGDYASS